MGKIIEDDGSPRGEVTLDINWFEAGSDEDPRSRLNSVPFVTINGLTLHLMAIEVGKDERGYQCAADTEFVRDLYQLQDIDGTEFQTTEIEGREYIIYATPHGA